MVSNGVFISINVINALNKLYKGVHLEDDCLETTTLIVCVRLSSLVSLSAGEDLKINRQCTKLSEMKSSN